MSRNLRKSNANVNVRCWQKCILNPLAVVNNFQTLGMRMPKAALSDIFFKGPHDIHNILGFNTIIMAAPKANKQFLCISQIVPTSLSLFLFRAFFEGAGCCGCWFEDRGWNRKKGKWHVSNETAAKIRKYNFTCARLWAGFDVRQASEADLTWQSHHKNRAISPDWCKL